MPVEEFKAFRFRCEGTIVRDHKAMPCPELGPVSASAPEAVAAAKRAGFRILRIGAFCRNCWAEIEKEARAENVHAKS